MLYDNNMVRIDTLYEGVRIRVVSEVNFFALEVDGDELARNESFFAKSKNEPCLQALAYPFKSGEKDIIVYSKANFWGAKYNLFIDGEKIEGEY